MNKIELSIQAINDGQGNYPEIKCVARWLAIAQTRRDVLDRTIKDRKKIIENWMEYENIKEVRSGRLKIKLGDPLLQVMLPKVGDPQFDKLMDWCKVHEPDLVKSPVPHSSTLAKRYRDRLIDGRECPPVETFIKDRLRITREERSKK